MSDPRQGRGLFAAGLLLVCSLTACDVDTGASYIYASNITGAEFVFFHETEAVHPSQVTLENPHNIFREMDIGAETKWDIHNGAGNAAAFYVWATLLSQEATGEHQFYAATTLAQMLETGEIPSKERAKVRTLAVAGFQAVLDWFPESVSYTADLTPFRLDILAYDAIKELQGTVKGGWVKVEKEPSGFVLIQVESPPPAEED
jgi:hypothetical protein